MSRKHNTRHDRSKSHYKERLEARGLSRAPAMTVYDQAKAKTSEPGKAWAR